jgi:N-methylhydantoinase B
VDADWNLLVEVGRDEVLGPPARAGDVDPLTLGTIWRTLVAAANDAGTVLQRTAYSEAVREGRDFSVAVFDRHGRLAAQGDFSPGHLGSMPGVVRHVLEYYDAADLRPDDAILLNDPWLGSGHLPDFLLTTPIFHGERLVGFAVSCVHMIDVGGAAPGSQAVAGISEVFQEGLRFLPTRIWHEGEPNEEMLRLIEANVRVPDKLIGDLKAMRNAGRVAAQRLVALVDRFGAATFDAACATILERSAAAMRASIAELPDGPLHAVDWFDDCGPGTEPLRVEVTVTIDGDDLTIDFAGSSPQTRSGINAVANYTRAYCYFVGKAVTHGPALPQNAGSIEPIRFLAPEGSVVNARPPVGVGARAIMQQRIVDVLMQALAPVVPERVLAPSSHWANPIVGGIDPRTGRTFVFYEIVVGGFGGRYGRDGIEAMCPSFNIDGIPVEVNEHAYPVLVDRYELIRDSAGAGRWRGGHGVRKDIRLLGQDMILSNLAERHRFPPPGILGGGPGGLGATILNSRRPDEARLEGKGSYHLATGDTIAHVLSGGGGFGDPLERDPEAVVRDVRSGWLSRERAREAYGVVVDETGAVDADATCEERDQRRAAANGSTSRPAPARSR